MATEKDKLGNYETQARRSEKFPEMARDKTTGHGGKVSGWLSH